MKIALVILHADTARGGAERYTIDLAVAMLKRGHEVSLLASSFADVPEGVASISVPATGASRIRQYRHFLKNLDQETGGGRFDIVHAMLPVRRCDVYHPHAGVAADAIEAGHLKKATAISRALSKLGNRFNFRRRGFAGVERQLLDGPNPPVVLCLSEQIKSTVRKSYPRLQENRLMTLFNSTDLTRFDPAKTPDPRLPIRERLGLGTRDIVGLMLAQDFERKGLRQMLEALARISDPRLKILVAGKQDPAVYRKLAARLGVIDRVRFAGPTQDPPSFYRAADFFVLPTRADPCSLVVLEALAMGVPVISTVANGACEIMVNGLQGRILPDPDDIKTLSEAMAEMLNADIHRSMVTECLRLREKLSAERHLDALESLYHRICGAK